ncbi:hypothetical protein PR202_ga22619 [Eleusine coracana subsp. coracana]|uniref:Dirigent protein n=1 Tax=Eleusine coracana subsp. coracana TaxID=191504 RepID=A0AAV5D272_ELECO|nr:hypothetical protein PR202_ga22619 [Eleusine coracana subsp. coracana]
MACCNLYSVLLAAAVVLATVPASARASSAHHLHFYMHDVLTGPHPTAAQVVNGTHGHFGDTTVIDDVLTQTSSRSSPAMGRAQGQYMWASSSSTGKKEKDPAFLVTMNVVLTSGPFAGSSVTVVGIDDLAVEVRELPVVGGTGKFRMARGYVLWKTVSRDQPNAVLELDVYVNNS